MLFKKISTRPLPEGAELFTRNGARFARWTVKGKRREARVTGEGDALRIQTETATWYARVRLADGSRADLSTGCRDKSAAAAWATRAAAEQEKIRAGVITQAEAETARHGSRGYVATVADFIHSMEARGCTRETCSTWKRYLESAGAVGLGWRTLRNMDRNELERWLAMRAVTPKDEKNPASVMGARTHNGYITTFHAFGVWCARHGYIKTNLFAGMTPRNREVDRRRIRRALTADEVRRLIEAARNRPATEALRGNRGRGASIRKEAANISTATLDRLRWLGETRAMAYWTAACTGLRWGELRSITLGAVRLDADPPHIVLEAKNEKARRGALIPLPADLAVGLKGLPCRAPSASFGRTWRVCRRVPGRGGKCTSVRCAREDGKGVSRRLRSGGHTPAR